MLIHAGGIGGVRENEKISWELQLILTEDGNGLMSWDLEASGAGQRQNNSFEFMTGDGLRGMLLGWL